MLNTKYYIEDGNFYVTMNAGQHEIIRWRAPELYIHGKTNGPYGRQTFHPNDLEKFQDLVDAFIAKQLSSMVSEWAGLKDSREG